MSILGNKVKKWANEQLPEIATAGKQEPIAPAHGYQTWLSGDCIKAIETKDPELNSLLKKKYLPHKQINTNYTNGQRVGLTVDYLIELLSLASGDPNREHIELAFAKGMPLRIEVLGRDTFFYLAPVEPDAVQAKRENRAYP